MLNRRTTLCGLVAAATFSLAASAFAQSGMPGPGASTEVTGDPGHVMIIYPNGRTVSVPLDKKMLSESMSHAKASSGPVMVLVANGKAYTLEDTKMPSGEMMSQYLGLKWMVEDRLR